MSVQGNYLVFPNKKYLIYTLTSTGAIRLTCKFLALYRAFFVRIPTLLLNQPSAIVLPTTNPVSFSGTIDTISGFMDFVATTPLDSASAVTTQGIALNFFRSGYEPLDFQLSWEGTPDIQFVNIYNWNPGYDLLRLNYDCCDNLSSYKGSSGSAVLPYRNGSFYVKVISTAADPHLSLTVKALASHACPSRPEGNGCLLINGQSVPLYTTEQYDGVAGLVQIIPAPQWQYIADLITNTIDVITALPIPLTPIEAIPRMISMDHPEEIGSP